MIFRSPSNDNTRPLEADGSFVIFWRRWFTAVAQWLLEASRTNRSASTSPTPAYLPWVQQGPIVFLDYTGTTTETFTVGFSKGSIPPPASDTFILTNSGSVVPFLAASEELTLTVPSKGWYIAKEATND